MAFWEVTLYKIVANINFSKGSYASIFMVGNAKRWQVPEVHNHNIHRREKLSNVLAPFFLLNRDYWLHTHWLIDLAMMYIAR
jgi:hypothetical protein